MSPFSRRAGLGLGLGLLLAAVLSACNGASAVSDPAAAVPVAGYVTDLPRFEQFVATRPTPGEFRHTYPDVTLVLPGQMATKEFRMNNSRYFAELDDDGRIKSGKFQ